MKYRCWIPDYADEDDGCDVNGYDAESAACQYVEWYERRSCEYTAASGGKIEVSVRTADGIETFTVTGEAVPHYRAVRQSSSTVPASGNSGQTGGENGQ